jgi:hypothetical protein
MRLTLRVMYNLQIALTLTITDTANNRARHGANNPQGPRLALALNATCYLCEVPLTQRECESVSFTLREVGVIGYQLKFKSRHAGGHTGCPDKDHSLNDKRLAKMMPPADVAAFLASVQTWHQGLIENKAKNAATQSGSSTAS